MTPVEEIIVEALGQAAALFEPLRDPRAPCWGATWVLRWRFRGHPHYGRSGLPYRGSGEKNRERDLAEAARFGWVERRRARQKTIGLILTPRGLAEAWRLVGFHPYDHVIVRDEVDRLAPSPGAWVPEIAFNDDRGWGFDGHEQELKRVAAFHMPALVAQLIESNCTLRGHVCYRATDRPRPETPEGWGELPDPEPDPDAIALYGRVYRETISWLDAQKPEDIGARAEIGELYLATWALLPWQEAGGYLPIAPPGARPPAGYRPPRRRPAAEAEAEAEAEALP